MKVQKTNLNIYIYIDSKKLDRLTKILRIKRWFNYSALVNFIELLLTSISRFI